MHVLNWIYEKFAIVTILLSLSAVNKSSAQTRGKSLQRKVKTLAATSKRSLQMLFSNMCLAKRTVNFTVLLVYCRPLESCVIYNVAKTHSILFSVVMDVFYTDTIPWCGKVTSFFINIKR